MIARFLRLFRRRAPLDLAAMPWWYCCYCGSVFEHPAEARDVCPTFEALSVDDRIARTMTPTTGGPNE